MKILRYQTAAGEQGYGRRHADLRQLPLGGHR